MTREEAIRELKILKENYWDDDGYGHEIKQYDDTILALDMAIKSLEQEPCEDCVSRKAVVEYIKNSYSELGYDRENELVVEDILTMPSVKPVACIATVKFSKEDIEELVNEKMKDIVVERKKGEWIPCDERLPEDGELVLFSTKTDRVYEGRFFVDNTDFQWYAFRDEAFAYNNVVTAWLPLPKPYKAESEDKE